MSKKKMPASMDELANLKMGKEPQSADKAPTNKPQTAYDTPTEDLQRAYDTPMKDYRVRLPESWWKSLQVLSAQRGMKPSQLIRELVAEYLRSS